MKGGCSVDTFGYRPERPAKCCANCAFSGFIGIGVSCQCLLKASSELDMLDYDIASAVETCGVCDRWLSRQISIAAKTCSSFEEFRLKRDIIDETAHTPELDEWFSERKATRQMIDLVLKMRRFTANWLALTSQVESKQRSGPPVFSRFPLMAKPNHITKDGIITQLYSSDSFWSVWHWISENKPAYDEWLGRKRAEPKPADVAVRPFMNSDGIVFL